MGRELKNTFSWSFSAGNDFEECRRKRYWSKYGMWGGWSEDASEPQRKAYQLNKMINRFMLQGDAVEKAVMWVLRQKQEGAEAGLEEAYEKEARPFLIKSWQDSKRGLWKQKPKIHCCLHEHYYCGLAKDKARENELVREVAANVKLCIGNFIETVLPRLQHIGRRQEIAVNTINSGDPESFEFEGIKVYAIPDYVYCVEDEWHIHDWKSGKSREQDQEQVAIYGLWAHKKHNVPATRLSVHLEYLREGRTESRQLSSDDLEAVKGRIISSSAEMAEYLVDGDIEKNESLPKEEWDLVADTRICQNCNFLELCKPELE